MSTAPQIGVYSALLVRFSHRNLSLSNAHFPRPQPAFACSRLQRGGPTCAFGGKGKQQKGEGNDDAALWKSLEKSVDNLKKDKSIEGMLRQQIQKQDFSGGDDSRGGGGGNFRGRGDDGSSEFEPEDHMDEFIQVFLASIGIICVYIYTLQGPELIRLFKDCIKYRLGGKRTVRMKRAEYQLEKFMNSLRKREPVTKETMDSDLTFLILRTPTRWHKSWKVNEVDRCVIEKKRAKSPDPRAVYKSYA